jgi:hypothetical protein
MTGLDPVTHAVRPRRAVPRLLENPGFSWRRLVLKSGVGGRVKPGHDGNQTIVPKYGYPQERNQTPSDYSSFW